MAFVSFVGRLLFASVFFLSAWHEFNEFGVDGGPAAEYLRPKFDVFSNHLSAHTGVQVPKQVEIKHLVAAMVALKGIGGLLFIFGSSIGAYLLLLHQAIATPILYDFYNYDPEKTEFNQLFFQFAQDSTRLELGILRGSALFRRHEDIDTKETTTQEKSSKTKNYMRGRNLG
ncbi:hypothetical protein C1H46_013269 [Malus baccata]|uniref:HR-like lesion-inducer n=1 Tax=Malus baccata TaxID=106549 RepID=A0A540MRZ3_MALBA|nr:hypothetical protein C1H46_013269 [Malus baccata]